MFFIMLSLAISLIIVIFALQNSTMVPIVFFNWSSEIPLVVLIFASVLAGATIIFLLALWKDLKQKFNTVSSKASQYKSAVNSKKEALTEKLERRKTPEATDIATASTTTANPPEQSESNSNTEANEQDKVPADQTSEPTDVKEKKENTN